MTNSVSSKIEEANEEAVKRILSAECNLVDIDSAGKIIPGFKSNLFTHPLPLNWWSSMSK